MRHKYGVGNHERSVGRADVGDCVAADYHGPGDMYGPEGLVKQLSKALIERAMRAELTEQPGYEKSGTGGKPGGTASR